MSPATLVPVQIADGTLAEALSRVLAAAAGATYLVGGAVRDLLLRRSPRDLDVVVEADAIQLGRRLEQETACKPVVLNERPAVVRLVWHAGAQVLDLLELEGTLDQDLRRRDCTVNAMALRLVPTDAGLAGELRDPLSGRDDLHARLLRMTSEHALTEDPVRVLRVFRLAAQLGFEVEDRTRSAIVRHADEVRRAAPERVQEELLLLLEATPCNQALRDCAASGVLLQALPELAPLRGLGENGYHHLDAWAHSLEVVEALDTLLLGEQPLLEPDVLAQAQALLARPYLTGCTNVALLKLAGLLHDVGKPATATQDERGLHFYRHDVLGAQVAEDIAARLRFSREAQRALALLVREHLRPGFLADLPASSERAVNRFFRRLGDQAVAALLLALADRLAARGPAATEEWLLRQARTVNTLAREYFRRAQQPASEPLLNGHDLMARYDLQPGRLVGKALALLRRAQQEGQLRTRAEAEAWLDARMPQLLRDTSGR